MNRTSMHHFFITPYSKPPASWQQAFPAMGAVQQAMSLPPVLSGLLWLHYPQADSLSLRKTMAALRHQYPHTGIVVLSNTPSDEEALEALQLGASGYCHALVNAALLTQIATVVGNGGLWVGETLLKRLMQVTQKLTEPQVNLSTGIQDTSALGDLSPRERAVAMAVAAGASNKEVARQLKITERTVKAHLSSVFEKLAVRDRLQLALYVKQASASLPA